jgi:hypothetical protein
VIMLIRRPDRGDGFDVALASTDIPASTAELIARYDGRWTIETAHQEAKAHGVGQARNRVQRAVERTVPFGFLCQTITIAWYALHGNPQADLDARRRSAPWYRHKATISYADMLAALRHELIRHEYWAQAPGTTSTPQITHAPSLSALAAAWTAKVESLLLVYLYMSFWVKPLYRLRNSMFKDGLARFLRVGVIRGGAGRVARGPARAFE